MSIEYEIMKNGKANKLHIQQRSINIMSARVLSVRFCVCQTQRIMNALAHLSVVTHTHTRIIEAQKFVEHKTNCSFGRKTNRGKSAALFLLVVCLHVRVRVDV